MSDLQLSLIVIGGVLIVVVLLFNRWQERQLRRRVEETFDSIRPATFPDARSDADDDRIEPTLERMQEAAAGETPGSADPGPRVRAATAPPVAPSDPVSQPPIDYVCSIESATPMAHHRLAEFLHAANAVGKCVSLEGWMPELGHWVALPLADARPIMQVRARLQLADRAGPVNRVQLATMRDLVRHLAQQVDAQCECPEIDDAMQAAVELDRFCAEIDVSISCHVVPRSDAGLPGTKVRGLLESYGYGLAPDGKFWLHADDGAVLLSVGDAKGEAFSVERLRTESFAGLTLSMDVPKAPAAGRLFDRMLETARHLAHALDAIVVDDNRRPLTDAGLAVIRQQVRAVQAAMEGRGIAAGSATAARLFS